MTSTKRASELPDGIYEQLVTRDLSDSLDRALDRTPFLEQIPESSASSILARHLFDRFRHALESFTGDGKLESQIQLTRDLLDVIRRRTPDAGAVEGDDPDERARLLVEMRSAPQGLASVTERTARPRTPLSTSELLTNSRHDARIGHEIAVELASSDRVDLLCSFVKWSGLQLVLPAIEEFLVRKPGGLRVLTTTYVGATERRALDKLVQLGARVKVSYDTKHTRLHAKAWMFHRASGFTTAYVGSSNLSGQAMLDGMEWNVRLSAVDNGRILDRFANTFEQYWQDADFEPYEPARDAQRFDEAIAVERRGDSNALQSLSIAIEVAPRRHQQEVLDELRAERDRGHQRNLVVAATGTGKTVIAALDYRRLAKQWQQEGESQGLPSLLFVAHRDEILRQSQDTFRIVLRRATFGERFVGGDRPSHGRHVFASIQSFREGVVDSIEPNHFDVVIVDEFHHAAAQSYSRLLDRLEPRILLGLTATPERADGLSILHYFDGRIASELRLWKALDRGLLAPFHYFGLEGPDVRRVPWSRGRFATTELSNVYTGHDWFVRKILAEVHEKVLDPGSMRCLGFCVDVDHAKFMAEKFVEAGLRAVAVTGASSKQERRDALERLRDGDIQTIFSVDLFNEGVDLPDVDTILMLRPTESATVFLQQLGRGLRRSEDKTVCVVLDFIGMTDRRFRFDQRFRSIVGGTRRDVEREVAAGFPSLPSGCSILLEEKARAAVLENIRAQVGRGRSVLVDDLRELGPETDLRSFVERTGVDVEDIYARAGDSFRSLREQAGFAGPLVDELQRTIERSFWRLLHLDDLGRLDGFRDLLNQRTPPAFDPSNALHRMLFVALGAMRSPLGEGQSVFESLWDGGELRSELYGLLGLLRDRSRRITTPLAGTLEGIALETHGTYSQDEVLAALDVRNRKGGILRIQTGAHYWRERRCDLFFVTIDKSEADYSPTTMYQDYPISDRQFHWESVGNCHPGTPTGKRYLEIGSASKDSALLFVRKRRKGTRGETQPYVLLGPVSYGSSSGERPMQIVWNLEQPMTAGDYQEMKLASG